MNGFHSAWAASWQQTVQQQQQSTETKNTQPPPPPLSPSPLVSPAPEWETKQHATIGSKDLRQRKGATKK